MLFFIFLPAPPPGGIIPAAHQTSVYSYSVQQHPPPPPPLLPPPHPAMAAMQGQPPPPSDLSASQHHHLHQAMPQTKPQQQSGSVISHTTLMPNQPAQSAVDQLQEAHTNAVKQSYSSETGLASATEKGAESLKLSGGVATYQQHNQSTTAGNQENTPLAPVAPISANKKSSHLSTGGRPISSQSQHAAVSRSSTNQTRFGAAKDKDMQKRAHDLAGKISATVTITTNSSSKNLGGGGSGVGNNTTREKNDFLAMQNTGNTNDYSSTKAAKPTTLQGNAVGGNQVHGKRGSDKFIPNLANLKPIPPSSNTLSKQSSVVGAAHQQASESPANSSSPMMATITPIYSPISMSAAPPYGSTVVHPVPTTKSSLRDYRKPKVAKGIQPQQHNLQQILKSSTNMSTNNKF